MTSFFDIIFTSGGNGRLMAIDMGTGKVLWRLRSPDSESYREVAVFKGDDKTDARIVCSTYKGAYAFPLARK